MLIFIYILFIQALLLQSFKFNRYRKQSNHRVKDHLSLESTTQPDEANNDPRFQDFMAGETEYYISFFLQIIDLFDLNCRPRGKGMERIKVNVASSG